VPGFAPAAEIAGGQRGGADVAGHKASRSSVAPASVAEAGGFQRLAARPRLDDVVLVEVENDVMMHLTCSSSSAIGIERVDLGTSMSALPDSGAAVVRRNDMASAKPAASAATWLRVAAIASLVR
jgi:hypothetical protein